MKKNEGTNCTFTLKTVSQLFLKVLHQKLLLKPFLNAIRLISSLRAILWIHISPLDVENNKFLSSRINSSMTIFLSTLLPSIIKCLRTNNENFQFYQKK